MKFWHWCVHHVHRDGVAFGLLLGRGGELIHKVTPSVEASIEGQELHTAKHTESALSLLCSQPLSINVIWEGCKHPAESPCCFADCSGHRAGVWREGGSRNGCNRRFKEMWTKRLAFLPKHGRRQIRAKLSPAWCLLYKYVFVYKVKNYKGMWSIF